MDHRIISSAGGAFASTLSDLCPARAKIEP
jgi:hypothetical protein